MLLPAVFRSLEEDYWYLVEHVQLWDFGGERQVILALASMQAPRHQASGIRQGVRTSF